MKNQVFKDVAAVFIIMFLLPYVVTIFVFGFPEKSGKKEAGKQQTVCIAADNYKEEITLEQYLTGVLAAQIPVGYEMEALKAHAVLARTHYAGKEMQKEVLERDSASQSFLTTEQMKNLWGEHFEENYRKLEQAVTDTGEECICYKGALIETFFHTASVGKTRNGEEVFGDEAYGYLVSSACEYDLQADNYVTIKTYTKEELCEYLTQFNGEKREKPIESFQIMSRDKEGYVTSIAIEGQVIHGETFRSQMKLPSAAFQIEEWESGVRFVCKGLGHGLGMSLNTANELAKEGKNYQEILQYFFHDITIENRKF